MSSHDRRGKRSLWSLFSRGTNTIHEGPSLWPNHFPKATPPTTIVLGIRFQIQYEFEEHINIQSLAAYKFHEDRDWFCAYWFVALVSSTLCGTGRYSENTGWIKKQIREPKSSTLCSLTSSLLVCLSRVISWPVTSWFPASLCQSPPWPHELHEVAISSRIFAIHVWCGLILWPMSKKQL